MPLGEWIASAASQRFAEYRSARLMYEAYLREGVPSFTELTAGDFQRAAVDARLGTIESSYRHVIEASKQVKDYRNIAVAFYQLGMLFHSQGKFQESDEQFRQSLDVAESLPELLDHEISMSGDAYTTWRSSLRAVARVTTGCDWRSGR